MQEPVWPKVCSSDNIEILVVLPKLAVLPENKWPFFSVIEIQFDTNHFHLRGVSGTGVSALPEFPSSEILIEVFQICTLIAERKEGRNYSQFISLF